jgi:hypothetical protein
MILAKFLELSEPYFLLVKAVDFCLFHKALGTNSKGTAVEKL